ncbi:hypothetical protein C8R44DRAFT_783369 [Mycena epipterygia]|nr:hypothetical protein C8R44DRAFT_783369 [Mycena epipterygia]
MRTPLRGTGLDVPYLYPHPYSSSSSFSSLSFTIYIFPSSVHTYLHIFFLLLLPLIHLSPTVSVFFSVIIDLRISSIYLSIYRTYCVVCIFGLRFAILVF